METYICNLYEHASEHRTCFNCALAGNPSGFPPKPPSADDPFTMHLDEDNVPGSKGGCKRGRSMRILRGRNDAFCVLCAECLAHFVRAWFQRLEESMAQGHTAPSTSREPPKDRSSRRAVAPITSVPMRMHVPHASMGDMHVRAAQQGYFHQVVMHGAPQAQSHPQQPQQPQQPPPAGNAARAHQWQQPHMAVQHTQHIARKRMHMSQEMSLSLGTRSQHTQHALHTGLSVDDFMHGRQQQRGATSLLAASTAIEAGSHVRGRRSTQHCTASSMAGKTHPFSHSALPRHNSALDAGTAADVNGAAGARYRPWHGGPGPRSTALEWKRENNRQAQIGYRERTKVCACFCQHACACLYDS